MADELTNDQIAALCNIGEFDPSMLTEEKRRDVELLLSKGYVKLTEKDDPASPLELTAKGIEFLGQRGAGLNEA
jgi:hypothetical protein